ncbi:MAG: hypothetical protein EOO48_00650 [Flavobacterium sp.]|nr:MAG: hypothetical protein EOO48_00650 [Flavobacterium sp.]
MNQQFKVAEGVFEIQYRQDFTDVSRYRKDYELFIVRFYPKKELHEEKINAIFQKNNDSLFDTIETIVEKNADFFRHFRIEKILHGDCCMRQYDGEKRRNVIACYMKKLKFVTIDRQKLPVV